MTRLETEEILERVTQASPRLGFIGPMVGNHPGYVTTQGQILAGLFQEASYEVLAVSSCLNRYLRLADIIKTIVRRHRDVDMLMLDVFGGPSFVVEDIASALGQRYQLPIVMILRGGAMPQFMRRYPSWCRRVLRRADVLVAPSSFLRKAVEPLGFPVRVIPNVIGLERYRYRPRRSLRPRLFWMRTFHPIYNPQMAIRVLARLRQSLPQATLVMAGQERGLGDETRRLARQLGVEDAVEFVGFLDREAKARIGDSADLFLNTNRVDNMPVSVVEACAMGLPVVATDVGGISDLLVDGESCLLVDDDDDRAMAEAVLKLLEDEELANRLSAQGRRVAEECAWSNVRPQWEQVFMELDRKAKGIT